MGLLNLTLPTVGQSNATEDVDVVNSFSAIQTLLNGNLDAQNLTGATVATLGLNGATTGRGATNIATSQNTASTTYVTLATPDQVTAVNLPANGLILVGYQATWAESVAGAARAAIFLGSNQLKGASNSGAAPGVQEAAVGGTAGQPTPLVSWAGGLTSLAASTGYPGDVTTGQLLGAGNAGAGGFAVIHAAAGTYDVSVRFKVSSGTVSALNRKLWVEARGYS
jgi:hypothetical protein